jgi:hypothetical protein
LLEKNHICGKANGETYTDEKGISKRFVNNSSKVNNPVHQNIKDKLKET